MSRSFAGKIVSPRVIGVLIAVVGVFLLAVLILTGTGYLSSPALKSDPARFWDTLLKAIGGVLALGGGAIAMLKYLDEKAQANDAARAANVAAEHANATAKVEARKPFDQQRQAIYLDLLSTTARIGNTRHGTPERKAAEDHFWFVYWGPLPLVSDHAVGEAVNRFSELMDRPDDEVPLRNASMEIAKACRASLGYAGPDGIVPATSIYPQLAGAPS